MKKGLVCFLFVLGAFAAKAQMSPSDTIRYGDPWYLFNSMQPLVNYEYFYYDNIIYIQNPYQSYLQFILPLLTNSEINRINSRWVQPYVANSSTLYGFALTVDEPFPQPVPDMTIGCYQGLSYQSYSTSNKGNIPIWIDTVGRADSLLVRNVVYKRSNFVYNLHENDGITPYDKTCSSYEFYFDNPVPLTQRDSLWVWGYFHRGYDYYQPGVYPVVGFDTNYNQFWIHFFFNENEYSGGANAGSYHLQLNTPWGLLFPIVQLRCVAPRISVVERGGGTATVRWQATEAGEEYQLAIGEYGGDPDSATLVLPSAGDSTHTFTGLADGVRHAVWVRKACHYTTPGYDTIVWSDWSIPAAFYTLGVGEVGDGPDFTVSPNPAHGTAQATLPEAALGGRLTLCDLAGRELATQTVAGPTARLDIGTLPPSVYLVKLVTPAGISTRRLVVER